MKLLDKDVEQQEIARWLSTARVVVGAVLFFFPGLSALLWTGERPGSAIGRMAIRGLGARDVAIGAGTIIALDEDGPVESWLQAGMLADASDAVAALAAPRLKTWRRLGLVALSGASVYVGLVASGAVEE